MVIPSERYDRCNSTRRAVNPHTTCDRTQEQERGMSITKLTPVWVGQVRSSSSTERPNNPPPRIIVGLLTGDGALAGNPSDPRRQTG